MNGRKAKELRRTPIMKVEIHVMRDGRVEVMGFPSNFNDAMQIMKAGLHRVANHFIQMAKDGKLDDKLTIEQSKIVTPNKSIVLPM